jgi:hypothetical protein
MRTHDRAEQAWKPRLSRRGRSPTASRALATGTYDGATFERYQYKITNSGRLWYFVQLAPAAKIEGRVLLERCEPGHPKQTDRPRKH